MENYTTTQEFLSQDVADTVYAIAETLSTQCHTSGVSLRECAIAEAVYITHVKPLEEALVTAQKQNAHTLGLEAAQMVASIMRAVSGNENSVQVSLGGARCPYCGHVSATMEEATEHDGVCPNHPGVIRAVAAEDALAKAETDRTMLVDALEKTTSILDVINKRMPGGTYYKKYVPLANDALMKARAALVRAKEE